MPDLYRYRDQRRPIAAGTFFSPASGVDGEYTLIRTRRWLHVFGLPVFPTPDSEDVVECAQTGARLHPSVTDPAINAGLRSHMVDAVRAVTSSMACADGPADPTAREAARAAVCVWQPAHTEAAVDQDLARAASSVRSPGLVQMSDQLEAPGKRRLLLAAAQVMVADGNATDAEQAHLRELGYLLRVTAADVRRVAREAGCDLDG